MKKLMLASLILVAFAAPVMAQTATAAAPVQHREGWQKLSPEQKQAKKEEMRAKWQAMSPEQREQVKAERKAKRQARYDAASPEQKAKMDQRRAERQAHMQERRAARGK